MAKSKPMAWERIMPQSSIQQCQCPHCQLDAPHSDQALHHQINVFLSCLDEQQRRWFAALAADRFGQGGAQHVARITGLDVHTIQRGRQELASGLDSRPADRVRVPGAGRPRVEKKPR
jgi:hypothetical protein